MQYLVCYDITNPKRLQKVAKTLEEFGIRIQKSFFQVETTKDKLDVMTRRILEIIKTKKDKFYIYQVCDKCINKAIKDGKKDIIRFEDFEIL